MHPAHHNLPIQSQIQLRVNGNTPNLRHIHVPTTPSLLPNDKQTPILEDDIQQVPHRDHPEPQIE